MKESEKKLRDILSLKNKNEGRKNYSIRAGAGGGKTTLLSIRISRQIAAGTKTDKFAVITYTNAAAHELRDKISDRLREISESDTNSVTEQKNAREALNTIELMQISTIHAFLLKILKEHAFEAGIVPDVRMLEDEVDRAQKEKFFNKWYREHFEEIRKFSKDWIKKSESTKKERDVTREVFFNMFMDLAGVREEIVYDLKDHSADFEKEAEKFIDLWLPRLVIFKDKLLAERPKKKDGKPKDLSKEPRQITEFISEAEGEKQRGCDGAVALSKALKIIKKYVKEDKSFYGKSGDNTPIEDVIPDIPACSLDWDFETTYEEYMLNAGKGARVVDYVLTMQKAYRKENDDNTLTLSNDDILFRAERLLLQHPEVLDKLRKKYEKIYVDEFQDTTGLQARLIRMLAEKPGIDSLAGEIQDDKLILVGDKKQSIYRFTGAEKALYEKTDAMMAGLPDAVAESVSLDTNFRSNKDIVDWVNSKFARLMPDYAPMESNRETYAPDALHGIYRYEANLGEDDKGKPIEYKKENDAEAVAELVKKLVSGTNCFIEQTVKNADETFATPILRNIQYSDIMIICRNTTNIKKYVQKFAEYGIPVNVQGKFKISDDGILKDFALLTEYMSNPKNKEKRIAAAQIISGLDVTATDKEEFKNAEEKLSKLRVFFRENCMRPAAIMRYLSSKEELFLPKGTVQPIRKVREYTIKLNQMIETCLLNNDGDISALSDLINDYLEKNIKREIPLESNENAVRLMNVHQAKGLTGGVVIIADRSNDEKCRYDGFKSEGRYYPAVKYKKAGHKDSSLKNVPVYGWDVDMLKQAYTEEMQESVRLQYVAATRAAHALIIMPVIGAKDSNVWFSHDVYGYDSLPDISKWLRDRQKEGKDHKLTGSSITLRRNTINLNDLKVNKAALDISELSEGQLISITPSGLELSGLAGYAPVDSGYVKESRPGGNVFGTVLHRVYELLFVRYEKLANCSVAEREKETERIINQAVSENAEDFHTGDDPEEFRIFLKEKMSDYFGRVIRPILEDALESYPEYSFSFFVSDTERKTFISEFEPFLKAVNIVVKDEPIWVNGQADLVVKKKDGSIVVYDYKSDAANGKPLKGFEADMYKKYEGQLALYKYAVGKAFGVRETKTELIHLYK